MSLRALVGVIALLLALAAPSAAGAASYKITLTEAGFVKRLGPLDVPRHPYLSGAERAFGPASSRREGNGVCVARWRSLRLKATFTSFGVAESYCRQGFFQLAVMRSRVWKTWRGLRVGMRSSRIRDLHPSAEFDDGKWVLATQSVYGDEPSPTVTALVSGGRVRAFSLFVGAAGD